MSGASSNGQTGSIVATYGALALLLACAVVGMLGAVGIFVGHSYSAVPNEAMDTVPAVEGFSGWAAYLGGLDFGELVRRLTGGM